jgi:hypothetical protein
MNKKILSLLFLLILLVSITISYAYFNQPTTEKKPYDYSNDSVNDTDIRNEIDNSLLDEDYNVESGEMI